MMLRKKEYSKYIIRSLLAAINLVVHVLFLEKITGLLELKNVEMFNSLLVWYIIYILVFEVTNFLMKKW